MVIRLLGVLCAFTPALLSAALPYATEPAFGNLSFEQPLALVTPPGETNRLFIVEKAGRIIVIPDLARPAPVVFLDITGRVGNSSGEQGLLALAFHPDFKHNRQFYVWYTSFPRPAHKNDRQDRLSRFLASADNPDIADPASEQRMISQVDEASNHNGGDLLFGPDGFLYVSVGDEGAANDQFANSQRIDKDFFAGILRLDVDQRPGSLRPNSHPSVHVGAYTVPPDNPFVGATTFNGASVNPSRVRSEFWAVGLRNAWRMSFDFVTGQLWCGDIGQNAREEVDLIVRGGNYGWNYREGAIRFRGAPPRGTTLAEPVWDYPRSEGVSITGGLVYRGNRHASLAGRYLFADYAFGHVWALHPDGDKPVQADRVQLIAQAPAIASFGLDPRNGDVLLASLSGAILRLVPSGWAHGPKS